MSASRRRILTVARREFLTTVKRKAFLLTLIGTPAYFAFVSFLSMGEGIREREKALEGLTVIGVVDSSGLYADAVPEIQTEMTVNIMPGRGRTQHPRTRSFRTEVRFFPDQAAAEAAVRAKEIQQALVIPAHYLEHGRVRRYARPHSPFSSVDRRAIGAWMAQNLVIGRVDAAFARRVAKPIAEDMFYTLSRDGRFEIKDDAREIADFLLPMMFSLLLGIALIIGGQYLLQGVAEEKESRILESLMCQVSADELLAGKLFGLGAVGLLVVVGWVGIGLIASGPALAMMPLQIRPTLVIAAIAYFLLGYLFFGSIMTGIAAITNNMREAQQFSVWFTFANFAPFIMITSILSRPDGPLAFWLSMIPPTASTAMMLRLAGPQSSVPNWQVALSLALLGATGWLALKVSARVFRIGLLLYGKTPNLPEIIRWARRG